MNRKWLYPYMAVILITAWYTAKIYTERIGDPAKLVHTPYINHIGRYDPIVSEESCRDPTCLDLVKCKYNECTRLNQENCETKYLHELEAVNDECDTFDDMPKYMDSVVMLVIDGLRYDSVCDNNPDSSLHAGVLSIVQSIEHSIPYLNGSHFRCYATQPTLTEAMVRVIFEGIVGNASNYLVGGIEESVETDNLVCKMPGDVVAIGDAAFHSFYYKCITKFIGRHYFLFDEFDSENDIINYMDSYGEEIKLNADFTYLHSLAIDNKSHVTLNIDDPRMLGPYKRSADLFVQSVDFAFGTKEKPRANSDRTMLVALSDHGMTLHGIHGTDSPGEVNSFLSVFTRDRPLRGTQKKGFNCDTESHEMRHQDITTNVSFLMGLPTPANSKGVINDDWMPIDVPSEEIKIAHISNLWFQTFQHHILSGNKLTDSHINDLKQSLLGDYKIKFDTSEESYRSSSSLFLVFVGILTIIVLHVFSMIHKKEDIRLDMWLIGFEAIMELLTIANEIIVWHFHVKIALAIFCVNGCLLYLYVVHPCIGFTTKQIISTIIIIAVIFRGALVLDPCGNYPSKLTKLPIIVEPKVSHLIISILMFIGRPRIGSKPWSELLIICCTAKIFATFHHSYWNIWLASSLLMALCACIANKTISSDYMSSGTWICIMFMWSISDDIALTAMIMPVITIMFLLYITGRTEKYMNLKSVKYLNIGLWAATSCIVSSCMLSNNTMRSLYLGAAGVWVPKSPYIMVVLPVVIRYLLPLFIQRQLNLMYYVKFKSATKKDTPKYIHQFIHLSVTLIVVRVFCVIAVCQFHRKTPKFNQLWSPRLFLFTFQVISVIPGVITSLIAYRDLPKCLEISETGMGKDNKDA